MIFPSFFFYGNQLTIVQAARFFTTAEWNYGQIEKEALAIIFATKKFYKMLYGCKFTLITDYKLLVNIFT